MLVPVCYQSLRNDLTVAHAHWWTHMSSTSSLAFQPSSRSAVSVAAYTAVESPPLRPTIL